MSDKAKNPIPKLRFPDFENAAPWKKVKLIDVADKTKKWSFIGGPFGSNLKSSDYVEDGVRVIQLQNIGDAKFIDNYQIFTFEEKANELLSNNIYPGEIIMSKMGDPVGRACLIPDTHSRYVMCSDGIRLVVDEENHSKYFIYSLINSSQFRALIEKTATGSTRKRIGLDDLKSLPMLVPAKDEQEKIASCLSSVDELIISEQKKLSVLKNYKKGLMQQLFPVEGEAIPRLRFPEFRGAGEWKRVPLFKVCNVLQGYGFPEALQGKVTGKYPFCKVSDISMAVAGSGGILAASVNYVDEEDIVQLRARLIPQGTTVFAKIGEALRLNRRAYVLRECLIDNNAAGLKAIQNSATDYFIYLLSQRIDLNKHCAGAIPSVNKSTLESIEVIVPNLWEQKRIANCLFSLDALIANENKKLIQLKNHKRGLMRQFFPVLDEGVA